MLCSVCAVRCGCPNSILDFVLYLVRLCAFHFSSFSICIVHQQLRWRCRRRLHGSGSASAVFALLVLLLCIKQFQPGWAQGTGRSLDSCFCRNAFPCRTHISPASHVHRACMQHYALPSPYIGYSRRCPGYAVLPVPAPNSWLMCHVQCNALLSNQTVEPTTPHPSANPA